MAQNHGRVRPEPMITTSLATRHKQDCRTRTHQVESITPEKLGIAFPIVGFASDYKTPLVRYTVFMPDITKEVLVAAYALC